MSSLDSFIDDIDAMVQATFSGEGEFHGQNPFDNLELTNSICANNTIDDLELPDQCPGVFYNLELKASTFVIRIFPSNDLSVDYPKILEHPEDYPTLRLLSDDDRSVKEKLQYFECDMPELAHQIKKELSNKRFPIFEEHVFNVSDPGDSWWVKSDAGELKVFFKLSRTESMDSLIKLGPLGDTNLAMEKFKKLYGYFRMLFPIADYASAHGQLTIKCEYANDPIFKDFVKIFTVGDSGFDFWDYLRKLEMSSQDKPYIESLKQANLFLMEIANMRRFWMRIQEQLN